MNKDLHNIDDVFNSAYKEFEDNPSSDVWQKINEGLDKKEANSYKKRFLIWKRATILLLLLVAGFALYESRILKRGDSEPVERITGKETNTPSREKQQDTSQNNPVSNNINNDNSTSFNRKVITIKVHNTSDTVTGIDNKLTRFRQKNSTSPKITQTKNEPVFTKNNTWNKIVQQKDNPGSKQKDLPAEIVKKDIPAILSIADKNRFLSNNEPLLKEKKYSLIPLNKINISKIAVRLSNSINKLPLATANDTLLKNNAAKNKKVTLFKPFWMIAPYASYERAGYRLDSDVPINITNIKHREAHEPSLSTGIFVTRQLTKHWGLQTGIIYSNTQIGISPQKLYAQQNGSDVAYKYITSSGYAYIKPGFGTLPSVGDSLSAAEAKHTLQYVSVPAIIKYTVSKKKLSFSPGAGMEANLLTGAKVETEIQNASNFETVTINKLRGTNSFYWSIVAEAEIQFSINKKVSVSLRPAFRYAISPITKNNDVETFPKSFGLGMGVKIKL